VSTPPSRAHWALLYGNFAIGCGVMVVPGSLNDLVRSLQVSVALGGHLVALSAAVMCFGAPLLAAAVGGWDRRRLLVLALAWYAVGHAVSALAPGYGTLVLLRAVSVLAAAVFTPQAAAAIGTMVPPQERGRAITFIFLGWSVASVLGMPVHAYIGETLGWRWAFALVAVLAGIGAWWVWRTMPDGVKPPAMNLRAWRDIVSQPVLMAVVLVTALSGAGQFTVFSFFAPYYRQVLDASAGEVSFLFFWFGVFGLVGNVLLSRFIDRIGAPRAVAALLACIAASLALWPLATGVLAMALVLTPWAAGCFSSNSAQQARLGIAAPALAPALMALNTSAIYLGQAVGAAGGAALVATSGYALLHWVGLAWLILAIGLSQWAARRTRAAVAHA
jgi:predicted MFS family arabinose efflux permease